MSYRYTACGLFNSKGRTHYIEIPSPYEYDSEEEAGRDDRLYYQFQIAGDKPCIYIYEEAVVVFRHGEVHEIPPKHPLFIYDYDAFKAAGGKMTILKEECEGLPHIGPGDFDECNTDFSELFPDIGDSRECIDHNAWYIKNSSAPQGAAGHYSTYTKNNRNRVHCEVTTSINK